MYRSDLIENPRKLVPAASSSSSGYSHAFGGPLHVPLPRYATVPFHLLYDLDLRDPALDFLEMEGIERLPFIFPLRYNGADVAYRVQPGGKVDFFGDARYKFLQDWPYTNYAEHFPRMPVEVQPFPYEEYRAMLFSNAAGWGNLRKDDTDLLEAMGHYTQLGGALEKPFGDPVHFCPNPSCKYHGNAGGMAPIANIWGYPMPGVNIWGDDADVVIVYSMCMACKAIYAGNTCD